MKLKLMPFLLMLALIAAFTSTPVSAKASLSKTEGVLQAISSKTHTLTLQVGSETKNYTYGHDTVFMNRNMRAGASALKTGEKVVIEADTNSFARRVEVLPSTPSKN